jgi:predicted phage terminase large subunit-like protein
LRVLRNQLGSLKFNALYLQEPAPRDGAIIKRKWLKYSTLSDLSACDGAIIQSWDVASEAGELNDYSVCITAKVRGGRLHIIDVFRRKLEFPDLQATAKRLALHYDANIVLVEKSSSGHALRQVLKAQLNASVREVKPLGDKALRLFTVSPMFENGAVAISETADWRNEFEKELLAFPNAKHDDQVDALSQMLAFVRDYSVERLETHRNPVRKRPNPQRKSSKTRQPRSGPRSMPIKLFGV